MQSELELKRINKLAKKSTWGTAVLTFFLPLFGYIYTGRYKALFVGFGITVGVATVCLLGDPSLEDDEDFINGLGAIYMIAAAIDNSRAVHRAKGRLLNHQQNSKSEFSSFVTSNTDAIKIQLLKLAKSQGEVTVADCVIETGCPAEMIRQMLSELQQDELMTIANRDRDGAVVYRII